MTNMMLFSPEYKFHVVVSAGAALPGGQVGRTGGGDEVVALPRLELRLLWRGGEGTEGDGEVHKARRLVAN